MKGLLLYLCIFISFITTFIRPTQTSVCKTFSETNCKNKNGNRNMFEDYTTGSFLTNFFRKDPPENTFFDKLKFATQCFNLAVFEDSDEFCSLPFEQIIDGLEYLFVDFLQFYFNYMFTIVSTVYKWKITRFFLNPVTLFPTALFLFYIKIFLPLKMQLENDLELCDENNCATCEVAKTNPLLEKIEAED